jgi:hypothetical protein
MLPLDGALRFRWQALNYLAAFGAGWLLPALLFREAVRLRPRALGFVIWLALGLVALAGSALLLLSLLILLFGPSETNRLSALRHNGAHWALHRHDCGATCGHALVLHELRVLPLGLIRYQSVWTGQGISEARLSLEQGRPTLRRPDGSPLWQAGGQVPGSLSAP